MASTPANRPRRTVDPSTSKTPEVRRNAPRRRVRPMKIVIGTSRKSTAPAASTGPTQVKPFEYHASYVPPGDRPLLTHREFVGAVNPNKVTYMARFDEECAEEEIEVKVGDKIQIYPTVKDEEAITDDDYWVGEVVKLHSIVKGQKKGRIFIEARMYYLWAQAEELFKRDEAQYAKELEMLEEAKETQAREKIKHELICTDEHILVDVTAWADKATEISYTLKITGLAVSDSQWTRVRVQPSGPYKLSKVDRVWLDGTPPGDRDGEKNEGGA